MNPKNDVVITDLIIGVSPAYFISRFSDRFSAEQMATGLEEVTAMGYGGFQPEVFHREMLSDWQQSGAARVAGQAKALGLRATQFVAHFMLYTFSAPRQRGDDPPLEDMHAVIDIVAHFDNCRIITVPLGVFKTTGTDVTGGANDHFQRFRDSIARLAEAAAAAGCRIALEIMPGSIIGGVDGYMRLCNDLGPDAPGLNFDTGHARAAGEDVLRIPERVGKQIIGTHLCDNLGHPNLSLRPGKGSIDWPKMIGALIATGYGGAWDIEIICTPERCREEYGQAHNFITSQLQQATARLPVR
jgi:sugar phosphate isomerase/epimerase